MIPGVITNAINTVAGSNFMSQVDALRYAGLTYVMKRAESCGLIGTVINQKSCYQLNQYWTEYLNICKDAGFLIDAHLKIDSVQNSVQLSWTPYQNHSFYRCNVCGDLVGNIQDHCKQMDDNEHTALLVHSI